MTHSEKVTSKEATGGTPFSAQGTTEGNPTWHGAIRWALDQARRDLVDLTRRNRLLHSPLTGKRPWCMSITGHQPDALFEKLYRQENFPGYAFSPREMDGTEETAHQNSTPVQPHSAQNANGIQLR
jgi:hypothetical protein